VHVHIGDTVQVIAGKDKGKVSEVTRISRHNSMVVLKDVNIKTRHQKPKAEGETGQIITFEAPVHSSNVALYSKTAKVRSRVGHKILDDGRKVRYLIKTGEVIDQPYQKPVAEEA
jgi:large subunit ribosomal protein L24